MDQVVPVTSLVACATLVQLVGRAFRWRALLALAVWCVAWFAVDAFAFAHLPTLAEARAAFLRHEIDSLEYDELDSALTRAVVVRSIVAFVAGVVIAVAVSSIVAWFVDRRASAS